LIDNILVPKHKVLTPQEAEEILGKYNVTCEHLPKIKADDPAISELEPEKGQLIKIIRTNPLIGSSTYYRVVI